MAGCSTKLLLPLTMIAFALNLAGGARILAIFPTPSLSHQVVYRALMLELNKRGHELVVITPDPVNDPELHGYTEIDVSCIYNAFHEKNNFSSSSHVKRSGLEVFRTILHTGEDICETIMGHEMVRTIIHDGNSKQHFDLIFMEWLITPCMIAFSYRFPVPVIGISSLPQTGVTHMTFRNPINPSYIPEIGLPYTDKNRTFLQRVEVAIFQIVFAHFYYGTSLPSQDAISKRYFGSSTPYIGDLLKQASMLFVNYLEVFHGPRPNVPTIVYINGFHIRKPKALDQDIQQFLDSAPSGAIYFSLGSNVRSDQLPADKRKMFMDTFAELPEYHVLWKWEADNLPGQPRNVKIGKWLPQQDILRHPKVKVFITQGGLQSTEEAIHMKVPMIGIPVFADQDYNTNLGQDRGITLRLELNDLTKTTLLQALRKVLEDKSYRENIERLSALVKDQPTTPMERAVWWTEYVLRHKGAKHLRSAAMDIPWYTYLLLDVELFLLAVALLVVVLLFISLRFVLRKVKIHLTPKVKTN